MPEDNGDSGGSWLFVPSSDACDICAGMAGVYDEEPGVPVHDNCRCQVTRFDDKDCNEEIRNVQSQNFGSWTITRASDVYTTCNNDGLAILELDFSEYEHRDVDEGMEDYIDVESNASAEVELPQGVEASFTATITIETTVYLGERWRVCTKADPVAGTHYEEVRVGDAAAYVEVVTDVEIDLSTTPC